MLKIKKEGMPVGSGRESIIRPDDEEKKGLADK
jgi:hypothetical protein